MSDFFDHGRVKIIALKKTGSSQLRRCFAEKIWDHRHVSNTWYVTAHRHPAARLVSGWNHLIKDRSGSSFAPNLPFPEFVDWICDTPDAGMNHHFRSQVVDLLETLEGLEIGIGSRLIIFQLEQFDKVVRDVCVRHLGRSIAPMVYTAHRHDPWPMYYSKEQLERVRRRFSDDMSLWLRLYWDGYWVSGNNFSLSYHLQWVSSFQVK